MASDQTEFLEKVIKIWEKQARRAQHATREAEKAANKTRKLQLQMLSMLKDCLQSHSNFRHRSKNSSANKNSKSANGNQFPTATPSKTNKHSSDGILDEFFITGRSNNDSNKTMRFPKGAPQYSPPKVCPARNLPTTIPLTAKTILPSIIQMNTPNVPATKHIKTTLPNATKTKKETFKSTHKNEIFMNQRFSSSEYGTESTHDKTPKEKSDNALFSQQDTDERTNEFSNEDPSQGCHSTNAPSKGHIHIALYQNQLFASSDDKAFFNFFLPNLGAIHVGWVLELKDSKDPMDDPSKLEYEDWNLSSPSKCLDILTFLFLILLGSSGAKVNTNCQLYWGRDPWSNRKEWVVDHWQTDKRVTGVEIQKDYKWDKCDLGR
jgi:hypothetical protein